MYDQDRGKALSLGAIVALVGLVIVVINAHSLFPELLFCSITVVLIGVIVFLVGHMFFWERTKRYVGERLRSKKRNSFARKYFEDFTGLVNTFTSLREFNAASLGIVGILTSLEEASNKDKPWIDNRAYEFPYVMQNPLQSFKQRLDELRFYKSEINERVLSNLVKEFENYIMLHRKLYVDLTVKTAQEIGLKNISDSTKKAYREYRETYNQFILEYTTFAKNRSREIGIFNRDLPKAYDL